MKLVFQKDALLNGISIVSKAIPSKTTMTILECILINADANDIKLTGNDMELGIETKVEGSILERGKIALEAKLFYEIVRKLPNGNSPVTITSDNRFNTSIECENASFHIQGRDGDEFSYLPYIERDQHISLTQFTLKESIRQTIFSISPNDSNKMMAGELMEVKDDVFKVVSLDGHRISIRNIRLKDHYEDHKVIIPGKTLSEISKICAVVVSRLIEGEYFKIDHMLSSDYETRVKVNKREFMDNIERAMIMIRDSDRKPIILNVTDNSINMRVKSSFGSMNADMTAHKTGSDIMIAFNPKFLLDALRVIDDEDVELYMMNPKSPCFIKDEDGTYIYLILPVNFIASEV